MKNTNWYAVFTASRAEKRVKERLEQAGIENYLPVRAVEFVRDGQKRRLEIPVITGGKSKFSAVAASRKCKKPDAGYRELRCFSYICI